VKTRNFKHYGIKNPIKKGLNTPNQDKLFHLDFSNFSPESLPNNPDLPQPIKLENSKPMEMQFVLPGATLEDARVRRRE